jgi:hypothetical protein
VIKNRYVTDSPWNIDNSMIHLRSFEPLLRYQLILDGDSYATDFLAEIPTNNFRWSQDPARPTIQFGLIQNGTENDIIVEYNVTTGVEIRRITLPFDKHVSGKETIAFVGGKQYIALLGTPTSSSDPDTEPEISVHIVNLDYDAASEVPVVASFVLTDPGCGHYDSALCSSLSTNSLRYSPDGSRVLVQYYGATRLSPSWRLLDVDLANGDIAPHVLTTDTSPLFGDPQQGHFRVRWGHPVFAYGANGSDVYVVGSSGNWRGSVVSVVETHDPENKVGGVLAYNADSNIYRSLTTPTDEAVVSHVTATNVNNPGYVFVAYAGLTDDGTRNQGEIVAINLENPGATNGLISLAHHRTNSSENCYDCQPHIAASPDASRLIFSTTWGVAQNEISTFLLDLNLPLI